MTVSASLSAAIKTQMLTVSNVGQVHDRPRYSATWSTYLDLFKATIGGRSVIRGWMISRDAAPAGDGDFDEVERVHNFTLTGIASLSDSDDLSQYEDMQGLADSIMAILENQTNLGVTGVLSVGPCSLESYDEQMFGSVLCHVLEIAVPIRVILPIGTA